MTMSEREKTLQEFERTSRSFMGEPTAKYADRNAMADEIATLRTQLAAAREALSNANERALAYDDELRTLRHRAERLDAAVEAARAIKEAVDIQYLDGEPSRIGHADSLLLVALDREVRTLDDASAG